MEADGVFSGGGIKRLAFAGALQVAEDVGYTATEGRAAQVTRDERPDFVLR
jgi:hypothetical protein